MDRKILEKAKKLQALVERGEMGEALAAKRALDALCLANGLDIETLFNEKKERKYFNCHIIMNTLGNFYFNVYIKF